VHLLLHESCAPRISILESHWQYNSFDSFAWHGINKSPPYSNLAQIGESFLQYEFFLEFDYNHPTSAFIFPHSLWRIYINPIFSYILSINQLSASSRCSLVRFFNDRKVLVFEVISFSSFFFLLFFFFYHYFVGQTRRICFCSTRWSTHEEDNLEVWGDEYSSLPKYRRDYFHGPTTGEITLNVARLPERLLAKWPDYQRDYSQTGPTTEDITLNVARLPESISSI